VLFPSKSLTGDLGGFIGSRQEEVSRVLLGTQASREAWADREWFAKATGWRVD